MPNNYINQVVSPEGNVYDIYPKSGGIKNLVVDDVEYDLTENPGQPLTITGGSGTSNYNYLTKKPKINNVELSGNDPTQSSNKSFSDLGLQVKTSISGTTAGTMVGLQIDGQTYSVVDEKVKVQTSIPQSATMYPVLSLKVSGSETVSSYQVDTMEIGDDGSFVYQSPYPNNKQAYELAVYSDIGAVLSTKLVSINKVYLVQNPSSIGNPQENDVAIIWGS